MSILIKGMKMPKDQPTRIVLNPNGQLFVDHGTWFTEYEAIELPDHGDLIDKTDLMASLGDWQLSEAPEEGQNWWLGKNVTSHELQYSIYRLLGDVYEEVRDEPAVIPAERRE